MSKGLEEIKTLRGFNQVELNNDENINKSLDVIEDELNVLEIIKESPFILQKIFENKGLKNQEEFDKRYFWGTITEDKCQIVEEWLNEKNN